jgi:hypothetical protein
MKKILYFTWFAAGSEFYRTSGVFPYIQHKGLSITSTTETNISFATILGYDTIIIERPSSTQSLNLIKLAKDMGIKVISDWDDNPLALDVYNPMYQTYVNEKQNVLECVALSDEIWVSTEAIKTAFKLYNRNIWVIPNAHHDYLFPVSEKREFTYNKKAMWRGGDSHIGDMYDIGVPEKIIEMVNGNPDWEFSFFGQRFQYLEKRCGDNYIAKGGASTVQFYKMMHQENACVFFYPLADSVFNRSKSNIAWIESTFSGSAFFGNTKLPEYIDGTILPIEDLIVDDEDILRFYNRVSWEYIEENLLLSKVNELRIERLLA